MAESAADTPQPRPWGDAAATPPGSPIRYTLTEADMILAQRAWLLAGLRWGQLLGIACVACALIGIVMLIDGRPLTAATIWPFVSIVLGVAMIPLLLYWRMPRRALKLFHQQKAAAHEISLSWDTEAISFASAIGHGHLPWSLFSSWLDAPAFRRRRRKMR